MPQTLRSLLFLTLTAALVALLSAPSAPNMSDMLEFKADWSADNTPAGELDLDESETQIETESETETEGEPTEELAEELALKGGFTHKISWPARSSEWAAPELSTPPSGVRWSVERPPRS